MFLFLLALQKKTKVQQQFFSQFVSQEEEPQCRERQREEPPLTQVTQPGQEVMTHLPFFGLVSGFNHQVIILLMI